MPYAPCSFAISKSSRDMPPRAYTGKLAFFARFLKLAKPSGVSVRWLFVFKTGDINA